MINENPIDIRTYIRTRVRSLSLEILVLSHMSNFNRHFRKVKFVKDHNCLYNYAIRNRFENNYIQYFFLS